MSADSDSRSEDDDSDNADSGTAPVRLWESPLRIVLVAVIAVAALAVAVTGGWLLRGGPSTTSVSSVDAGFARDMATHHTQAVIMAGYTRDTTSDQSIRTLAYDIEYAQNQQIGEMTGWLDAWNLTRGGDEPLMSWMGGAHADHSMAGMDMGTSTSTGTSTTSPGDTSLMPGMATPNEVSKLETLTGPALDVYFLQLMLRHHIGGVEMAQYAAAHAKHGYVRNLAQKMVDNQTAEIATMKQMLADRGAQPLP